jgi:hypothetical protein
MARKVSLTARRAFLMTNQTAREPVRQRNGRGGMQVDDHTWAAVRRAYADPSVPLGEIAERYGLTAMRIGARAKRENWPGREARTSSRRTAPAAPGDNTKAKPSRAGALPTRGAQRALIGRLYRAISLKLEHMEKRMASGKARSAQDEERESRALATLISNFEKVTEAVAELDHDGNARTAGAGADAERMRREIAERLERLGSSGNPEQGPRKPRS